MTVAVVSGFLARYPVGGNTWSYLQYVLGLQKLGFEVYYLEDSVDLLCYNPEINMTDEDVSYCVNYLSGVFSSERLNMGDKWAYRIGNECYGMSKEEILQLCRDAELFINVSGALLLDSWLMRDEYDNFDVKVFIDTDPAFNQFKFSSDPEQKDYGNRSLAKHDIYFTFGENIGEPDCIVPECGFKWNKTRQPVIIEIWSPKVDPNLDTFTTVMSWRPESKITYNGETYGQKDVECLKFIDLPKLTKQKIELAISGGLKPKELLENNWKIVSGIEKNKLDMWAYQRYIQDSRAEWSVAKNIYVKTNCGWFSERSACYLASAKPVLVQNTGFGKHLPTGKGLLAFNDMKDILNGIEDINCDYISHCETARKIAEEYFASDKVLKKLLRTAGF